MSKHTPGPWHIGMKPGPIIYGPNGEQIANMVAQLVDADERTANARLIAAAPDLLAALRCIAGQHYESAQYARDVAKAAIVRAIRESPESERCIYSDSDE